jgi:cell wall-associated NlpC family hydrolase
MAQALTLRLIARIIRRGARRETGRRSGEPLAEEVPVNKWFFIAPALVALVACNAPAPEAAQKSSQSVVSGCAYGEGYYCGGLVGLNVGTLYYCQNDQFTVSEECTDTCVIEAPGVADYCGSASGGASGSGSGGGGGGSAILEAALKYEGTPYVLGGPESCVPYSMMDCSCLTSTAVYEATGIDLPDNPYGQMEYGTPVDFYDLQPGDLVFFDTPECPDCLGHVGIYAGNGQVFHANTYTGTTAYGDMAYIEGYIGARRL